MLNFFWVPLALDNLDYASYDLSNVEIVKYAMRHLGRETPFALRSFHDTRVSSTADDVLLGHPTFENPTFGAPADVGADWVANNALTAGAPAHPNTYILIPWITIWTEAQMKPMPFLQQQLDAARLVFGLCGRYWGDLTLALDDGSLAASVKHKFVQVNMGCAAHNLPCRTVHPARARRTFLHVSNLAYYKRTDVLFESIWGTDAQLVVASAMLEQAHCQMHLASGHEVKFTSLGRFLNASPAFNQYVLDNCDFYIHTSDGDAQATSILENCARGLVPLVTPQSGFDCEYALELSFDPVANRAVIERAMVMPDAEYRMRSQGVRHHVEKHHAWDAIYAKIHAAIEQDRQRA
jgi:hypothetical protein